MAHFLPVMNAPIFPFILILTAAMTLADTRVKITGMTAKSETEVLELMGGRLSHVKSSDASPSRADDAAFLVRQTLRKDGYAQAEVVWKIVNREEILLTVREGGRLSQGSITVTGVPPDEARKLAKLYARPAEKDHPLIAASAPFREEDVEQGLSFLRQELNAQGYWAADAKVANRTNDPASGAVQVSVNVTQGQSFIIGEARIASADGRGVQETKSAAQPYFGKVANTGNLNAMRLSVEEAFNSSGYPNAKISMARVLEGSRFIPEFAIVLGKRVKLREVHLAGLDITNPDRIDQRFKTFEDDWYNEAAMNQRLRSLLGSGAFSSARLETTELDENSIDVTLHLEEARAKELSFSGGFGTYVGPIFRATYSDRNLWGEMVGFSSALEFTSRGVLGESRITDPWLFGSEVSGTARVFALIFVREGYRAFETGFDGRANWKIGDHYSIEALAGISAVNLTEDGLPTEELGETVYAHPRFRITQMLDFRDNPTIPTEGWHITLPIEIGSALGDSKSSYLLTRLSGAWYQKIHKNYQVVLAGAYGAMIPSGDGAELPIDLRLFNGGPRSVRSFLERELGPSAGNYPTGGELSWHTNAELIRNLTGTLKAVGFVDAGSLARSFDQPGESDLEVALGLGLRLDLPIGPVRLEYGYNLTRDSGEPAGSLHFAIGAAF
jgi:outer membrane protein insertion porin family